MRTYMPGPHAQFLEAVTSSTNIRAFVVSRPLEVSLGEAFNSAIAQLAGFRDKHIKLVTPSRNPLKNAAHTHNSGSGTNIATASDKMGREGGQVKAAVEAQAPGLYGTGGTQLIPFLQDTRNETRDTAVFPSS
jgi:indoleamine 2,3-dioxygenase